MTGAPAGALAGPDGDAARRAVLVTPEELLGRLAGPGRPVLLHVERDGDAAHRAGHLPGALSTDHTRHFAGPPAPGSGRKPLPDPARLQADARRWGLRAGDAVVVYDDDGGRTAARAWWVLRWAGVRHVRLLDGGLTAWRAAGGTVVTGDVPDPAPGDVVLAPGGLPVLDADGAARRAREGLLLDARSGADYRGDPGAGDRPAGHIPGAVSAPVGGSLGADGRFAPTAALRARFAALGAGDGAVPPGVYCGGGVAAAHTVLALAAAGIGAAMYPGSWSAWITDPSRPVATGALPG